MSRFIERHAKGVRSLPILLACSWVWFAFGCSFFHEEPCPKDQELLDRFHAREADFESLLADPDHEALRKQLGIQWHLERSKKPMKILFKVWGIDFFGPGGCSKGYAYWEETPYEVVESIDDHSDPGSPEEKTIFRPIQGHWYLYYSAAN